MSELCPKCSHPMAQHAFALNGDCYDCTRQECGCKVASLDLLQPRAAATVPDVADCECGHPKRLHPSGPCGLACPCVQFKLAGSKVGELSKRCYICDRPAHASGACPFVSHKVPDPR